MGLRNILFIISCIIVGFCLSLYFQTDTTVQTVNWDQYKNLQDAETRTHSLVEYNKKIAPYRLQDLIQETYEKNRLAGEKTRVMEIEAGDGRILMELKKQFPQVEFYALNREKTRTFYRRESFILTALKFEIFNKQEVEEIDLPYVVFQDLDFGARIPYDENKFDLIFSEDTITHIKYKFELFNEIMRVLRPGGVSFHTDITGLNIYSKGLVLELRDAMAEIRRRGIDVKTLENREAIRFKKSKRQQPFPVTPHQPIPENLQNLSQELRRPEMGYNINY
ncbi:methyltransferase domain-containing protein [Peredibacter sp. HCB2-198]|uniref:methyltransferase domain-containing protein n=1 Tax=Peredibacter sp. HCB2-198 TaxID=3383025 RepID=UPI0038B59462